MGNMNRAPVEVEEVMSILKPENGATLAEALREAKDVLGAKEVIVDPKRQLAWITWFRRTPGEPAGSTPQSIAESLSFLGPRTGLG